MNLEIRIPESKKDEQYLYCESYDILVNGKKIDYKNLKEIDLIMEAGKSPVLVTKREVDKIVNTKIIGKQ